MPLQEGHCGVIIRFRHRQQPERLSVAAFRLPQRMRKGFPDSLARKLVIHERFPYQTLEIPFARPDRVIKTTRAHVRLRRRRLNQRPAEFPGRCSRSMTSPGDV